MIHSRRGRPTIWTSTAAAALAEAINEFPGAVIMVSHDRYLIEGLRRSVYGWSPIAPSRPLTATSTITGRIGAVGHAGHAQPIRATAAAMSVPMAATKPQRKQGRKNASR